MNTESAFPAIRLKHASAIFVEYGNAVFMNGKYDSVCCIINLM
jgi:hypothetical protein